MNCFTLKECQVPKHAQLIGRERVVGERERKGGGGDQIEMVTVLIMDSNNDITLLNGTSTTSVHNGIILWRLGPKVCVWLNVDVSKLLIFSQHPLPTLCKKFG